MHRYRLYGLTLESERPFLSPIPPADDHPALTIRLGERRAPPESRARLFDQAPELWDGAAPTAIWHADGRDVLEFLISDQIELGDEEIIYRTDPADGPLLPDYFEARLLGSGLAWWLLGHGALPLHAAALKLGAGATLFMAESGMGKSSMTASLVGAGHPLLCDDFVAVTANPSGALVAQPAYPQLRLWPETIARFVGDPERYPTVYRGGTKRRVALDGAWGAFLAEPLPITRIYLLERDPDPAAPLRAERLEGHEAFMRILAATLMAVTLPVERLLPAWALIERLAAQAAVIRLRYPTGWERLPEVHELILAP